MRRIRKVTADEENFRVEPIPGMNAGMVRRDPAEPEPAGTLIIRVFRVEGYDRDCDGSLMARLDVLDADLEDEGYQDTNIGLYPATGLVVTEKEWKAIVRKAALKAPSNA